MEGDLAEGGTVKVQVIIKSCCLTVLLGGLIGIVAGKGGFNPLLSAILGALIGGCLGIWAFREVGRVG